MSVVNKHTKSFKQSFKWHFSHNGFGMSLPMTEEDWS